MHKFADCGILPDELIEKYMNIAIEEAFCNADGTIDKTSEVPVGCIIVDNEGNVVAK